MKRNLWLKGLLLSGLSLTLLSQSATDTYQKALVQEQAAGNLREAISLYRKAAEDAKGDRAMAAKALIRAAGLEEKLAEPHAADTYAEVLSNFAEQREQVATARARLTALRAAAPAQAKGASSPSSTPIPAVVDRMLSTYCVQCHNQRNQGGLNLEALSAKAIAEDPAKWETLLLRLRARRDPPSGSSRPDEGTYQTVISTLEVALDQAYPENAALASAPRVDDLELAERMAGFIWGKETKPDDELLNAARRGNLKNPVALEQQVRRMLRDPRASALVSNFFEKWMLRGGLEQLATAQRRFPGLDEELRQAFATETHLFLQSQLRDDRSALDLWTANYTYANERLARLYGLTSVKGNEFRRVTLADADRAGILGQGSFLAVTSFADRTSPTVRGTTIMRLFTGLTPPNPPPNVPPLKADGAVADRPMKEVLSQHTSNASCASCHRMFDPMGLALENFNPLGFYRKTQGGTTIDVSGSFTDGSPFTTAADFRNGLLKYKDAYYASITQSLLAFAIGRPGMNWRIHENEMPAVRSIVREAGATDYRWSGIVLGIIKSTPFRLKTLVP